MPARWVLSKVVETVQEDGTVLRRAKVSDVPDPGRPGKSVRYSALIPEGSEWALCFVRAADLSKLDGDPEIIGILEHDHEDRENLLAKTPHELGWPIDKIERVQRRLAQRGVDVSKHSDETPLFAMLRDLGRTMDSVWEPRGTWVR